jgi:hypothetical protein
MKHESELDWLEEPPWWKKTLKWMAWLALACVVAAGFGRHEFVAGVVGFVVTWVLRAKLSDPRSELLGFWMSATIAGVGLFLSSFSEPPNQFFWHGFTVSTALLGTVIFFLIRNAKVVRVKLANEVELMEFEWYRKQRFEKQQKEYDDWLEKHPEKSLDSFRFKKYSP